MSTPILVLGDSGTGKSASMRNMDPAETLLVQAIKKPLPFPNAEKLGWSEFNAEAKTGNIIVSDKSSDLTTIMSNTRRTKIILDDFQYVMANEFMRRSDEKGYDKFTEIGRHAWDVLCKMAVLPPNVRVYILAHTQGGDDNSKIRIKTIGKMLDEKITVEGMFSIVLRTSVRDGEYFFTTRNNGSDTVKTPMGMFADELIPNDLKLVDEAITAYGW